MNFRSPPSCISCAIAKQLKIGSWNFLNLNGHSLRTFCEIFGLRPGQVRSPGQLSWPFWNSQPRHWYSSRRISMKLTGLLEFIRAHKMGVSKILSWWPKVRPISWLPIISLWWNMRMLPVSNKPTEVIQLCQDHGHSPHLWWSGCNWRSGVTGSSTGVKWGHNPLFANKSWQDGDKDAQMVPNDLACRSATANLRTTLLGSWLILTWPGLRSNFEIDASMSKSTCSEQVRRGEHYGFIFIFVFLI